MEPNVMFLEKALDGRVAMDDISDALEEYRRLHKAGIASPAEILTLSRAYPENPVYAKALKKMNVNDDDSLVIGGPASIELVDREGHLITTAALDNAFQKYMSNFRTRNAMVLHSDVQVGWALPAYISKGGQIFKSGVDNKGLFFITELRNDTKIAKKVMEQINEGRLKSYSIAGSAVKTQTIQKGLQSVMQVDEMELAEVTVCEKGVNQGASFDIIKAENAATQSCVDGSCLVQKEESCGCESEPQGAEMIYKADGNINFVKSFLNFVKPQSGALQKILLTENNPDGLSFPTLINTQARQDEHHRFLDRYGFPEELEPEFARYTPVVEYNPNNPSPPWLVNEAGQNLGIRYYEEALTTPQIGTHTKRGVVEGANSNEVPVSELNSTDMFRNILSMITSQKAKEQERPLAKQATDIKISKADDFFNWMAQENKHLYKEDCPCEFCFQKNADYRGVVEKDLASQQKKVFAQVTRDYNKDIEKAIPLAAVAQAIRRGAKKVATSRAAKEAGKGAAFMGGASLFTGGGRDNNAVQGSSVRNSVDLKKKDYNLEKSAELLKVGPAAIGSAVQVARTVAPVIARAAATPAGKQIIGAARKTPAGKAVEQAVTGTVKPLISGAKDVKATTNQKIRDIASDAWKKVSPASSAVSTATRTTSKAPTAAQEARRFATVASKTKTKPKVTPSKTPDVKGTPPPKRIKTKPDERRKPDPVSPRGPKADPPKKSPNGVPTSVPGRSPGDITRRPGKSPGEVTRTKSPTTTPKTTPRTAPKPGPGTKTTPKTQPKTPTTMPKPAPKTSPKTAPKPGPGTRTKKAPKVLPVPGPTPDFDRPTKPDPQPEKKLSTKLGPELGPKLGPELGPELPPEKDKTKTKTQTQTQTQTEAQPSRITRTAGAKVPPLSGRSAPSGISRISPVPGPAEAAGRRLTIEDDTAELRENRKTAGGTRLSSPGARTRARVGADTRGEDRGQSRRPVTGFQRMVKEAVQDAFLDLRK